MSKNVDVTPTDEKARIAEYLQLIKKDVPLPEKQRSEILATLEAHECWEPYFRCLRQAVRGDSHPAIDDYVQFAKAQNLYQENTENAARTCAELIAIFKLSYHAFKSEALPKILYPEDWVAEACILQAAYPIFESLKDQVACLERLCVIYEKKTFNEERLNETYTLLIRLDPKNIKALRYFKVVYTQTQDWPEVVKILMTMLTYYHHPQEAFRTAQELAAVYLYQLDKPVKAIQTLEEHCTKSPLNSSMIRYEAYHRLGDLNGCVRVLRECLLNVEEEPNRAILHFKIAQIEEKLGLLGSAKDNYEKALKLNTPFLDAIESRLTIALVEKNWLDVVRFLDLLARGVSEKEWSDRVFEAQKRLEDGLQRTV